ncbi:MAG: hypothetical protein WA902_21170 [Thermosynechococcaceae cyanobacterium]
MALPDNFSPWEHLQSTVRQVHNRIVRQEFSDLGEDDDITIPRGSLRVASLIDDNDNASMIMLRFWLFYIMIRKASDMQAPIYGIPAVTFQESWATIPQIILHFREDRDDVDPDYQPVRAEIKIRWRNQTPSTISNAEVNVLANKINSLFATAKGYRWHKGRLKASYKDKEKNYNLVLFAFSESEARRVIEQVLDIQSDTPDWDNLTLHESQKTFQIIPPLKTIIGKQRRTPRQRPVAYVRFRRAELHVHGLTQHIVLVDRDYISKNPIIRAA